MGVTQGNQPHPTEHHNLDERLEGLLIKLIDYTKLGTVSKNTETADSKRYPKVSTMG